MPLRGRVQPCVRPVDAAPMALMKSADRIPNHLSAHEALGPRGFLRSPVRPVCHHVSPPLHSPLTSVMQPAERDLGYMAGAT